MNLTYIYSEIPLDLLLIYTINYRVCHRIYSQKPRLLFHTHFFGFIPFQAIYDEATPPPLPHVKCTQDSDFITVYDLVSIFLSLRDSIQTESTHSQDTDQTGDTHQSQGPSAVPLTIVSANKHLRESGDIGNNLTEVLYL